MEFNLLDILILISLSQGIIFGLVVLFGKLFKHNTNKYLAFSVILISIIGLDKWLAMWDFQKKYYFIDFFGDDIPWILLFFVPLLIYFLRSVNHRLANSRRLWFLTIPFLIFLILNLIIDLDVDFGWISAPFFKQNMYSIYVVEGYLAFAYSIFLCSLSYYIILRSKETDNIKWLKRVWFFTLLLHLAWLSIVFIPETVFIENRRFGYHLWIGVSFFIYFLSYKGIYQLNLVQNQAAIRELLKQKSRIERTKSAAIGNAHIETLKLLMEDEHLYRNSDLSLELVADRIGISVNYLSQQINTSLDKNFTSHINSYRVEDAKRMLVNPEFNQYSVLAIGLEAGFNSKSAFYNIFKKETGLTPNQFKNRIKKS